MDLRGSEEGSAKRIREAELGTGGPLKGSEREPETYKERYTLLQIWSLQITGVHPHHHAVLSSCPCHCAHRNYSCA